MDSDYDYEHCPFATTDDAADTPSDGEGIIIIQQQSSDEVSSPSSSVNNDIKLGIVFGLMVIIGTIVSVLNKLVAVPLYNYPNFLNVFGIIAYFILCLICTLVGVTVSKLFFSGSSRSSITREQYEFPKRTFAIMAILDTLSSSL